MHLISIKISGFKSFADQVALHVPRSLSGIVGPNGSGKSNVVDAIRWVVGESSAKSLRGGTLDDVIFSGSSKRKPAGQASVELLFDNSLSRCGGQWEKYAEISIRRTVTRDGISEYFINGTRSRRRDVKELFLGTGFGPRSYSIIEQGMISRIVEGKPEDLSEFIEEASGVSKFREKRHETLLKLKRVEINLERLDDMRGEIDKRIRQLKYQAEQARRYTEQKERLDSLRIQLLAYSWQDLSRQVAEIKAAKSDLAVELEKRTARVRAVEANLEESREKRLELESQLTDMQMELFRINAEISDCDRRIKECAEDIERTQHELQSKSSQLVDTENAIVEQQEKASAAGDSYQRIQTQLTDAQDALQAQQSRMMREEAQQAEFQSQVEAIDQQVIEAVRRRESAFAALEQNRQNLIASSDTINSVSAEIVQLNSETSEHSREDSDQQVKRVAGECDQLRAEIDQLESDLTENRTRIDWLSIELDALRESARETRVQLGALERSLAAAATEFDEEFASWLAEHNLAEAKELYTAVTVSDGWERAVDRVLGEKLTALCVDDIGSVGRKLEDRKFSTRCFFVNGGGAVSNGQAGGLAQHVESPNHSAEGLLAGVYTAESMSAAMMMQDQLNGSECVVTPDGAMVGVNWCAPAVGEEQSTGRLETANLVRELRRKVVEIDAVEEEKKRGIEELRNRVSAFENQLTGKRQRLARRISELERTRAQMNEREVRRLQAITKLDDLKSRERQMQSLRSDLETEQVRMRRVLQQESEALAVVEQEKEARLKQSRTQTQELKELQNTVSDSIRSCYQLELEAQKFIADQKLAESSITDLQQRKSDIRAEVQALETKLLTAGDPTVSLQANLNEFVAQRKTADAQLAEMRNSIEGVESERRQLDETRLQNQFKVEEVNLTLQERNAELGRLSAQCEEVRQKISDRNADAETVSAGLDAAFDHEATVAQLERLEKRIDSIGSVNLVAVEQYEQELERKSYMDGQFDDLTRAMETLQKTIRKIDRESRERYNETFSLVDSEFQRLIPRLFGGGSGHLELTGEYPDNAGLKIYARPKGKRIHNIQALSGGEKALTAVALILSMFQLNPSPVCLLDEIDAPLDDENVYRLCSSLHELSDATQMILITHNKITMESVDALIGVTMPEPNVSKVLSVDLLEAQEFAA